MYQVARQQRSLKSLKTLTISNRKTWKTQFSRLKKGWAVITRVETYLVSSSSGASDGGLATYLNQWIKVMWWTLVTYLIASNPCRWHRFTHWHCETGGRAPKCLLLSQPLLNSVFGFIEAHYQNSISLGGGWGGRSLPGLPHRPRAARDRKDRAQLDCRAPHDRGTPLALETGQSVEQIAEVVGYFDRRHSAASFSSATGRPLQAWRRTYQGRSIPLLQIDPQKASSNKLIKQRATTMTSAEAQRLQPVCKRLPRFFTKTLCLSWEDAKGKWYGHITLKIGFAPGVSLFGSQYTPTHADP